VLEDARSFLQLDHERALAGHDVVVGTCSTPPPTSVSRR
jgi:hypothetical protein